jgi:hypothetical protein
MALAGASIAASWVKWDLPDAHFQARTQKVLMR